MIDEKKIKSIEKKLKYLYYTEINQFVDDADIEVKLITNNNKEIFTEYEITIQCLVSCQPFLSDISETMKNINRQFLEVINTFGINDKGVLLHANDNRNYSSDGWLNDVVQKFITEQISLKVTYVVEID